MTDVDLRLLVRRASARLAAAGVDSDSHDAGVLAAFVLGIEPMQIVTHERVTEQEAADYERLVEQRCQRIPLQHLTGRAYFRRLSLVVGPGVFVPRPETEVVVEAVLTEVAAVTGWERPNPLVLDLCTGSGAIAASVAVEAPQARVVAVELSPDAHAWAQRNLQGLGVDLRLGDATDSCHDLDGTVDVVVANPPYIPRGAVIRDPEVAAHDPALALWGGTDGLDVIRGIVTRARGLLRPGGLLALEHADLQGVAVVQLLRSAGCYADVSDHVDLTGRDRFATARLLAAGSQG